MAFLPIFSLMANSLTIQRKFFQKRQPLTDTPFGHMCRALAQAARKVLLEKKKRFEQNQQQYLKHPGPPPINIGDLVYVNVSKPHTPKLSRKFIGPFIVMKKALTQVEIKSVRENSKPFWCHLERLKKGTRREPIMLEADEPPQPEPVTQPSPAPAKSSTETTQRCQQKEKAL